LAALAAEGEHLAAERIAAELLGNQGSKTVEAAAHVGRARYHLYVHAGGRPDHPRTAAMTRRSAGRLTSPRTRTRTPPMKSISIVPAPFGWCRGRVGRPPMGLSLLVHTATNWTAHADPTCGDASRR